MTIDEAAATPRPLPRCMIRTGGEWLLTDGFGDVYRLTLTHVPGDPLRVVKVASRQDVAGQP
jgi:hypothetical protein